MGVEVGTGPQGQEAASSGLRPPRGPWRWLRPRCAARGFLLAPRSLSGVAPNTFPNQIADLERVQPLPRKRQYKGKVRS